MMGPLANWLHMSKVFAGYVRSALEYERWPHGGMAKGSKVHGEITIANIST